MKPPTLTYDPEAGAWYLYLAARQKAARVRNHKTPRGLIVNTAYDARGALIGVEVVGPETFDPDQIARIIGVPAARLSQARLVILGGKSKPLVSA